MINTDASLDEQNDWMLKYRIDPIELGSLIKTHPSLEKSWKQFKTLYNLVREDQL